MSYGYVYRTTNLINNKIYVGQHKGDFNPKYFGSGHLITKALKKYGKENFKIELLFSVNNWKDLNNLERDYIHVHGVGFGWDNMYNIAVMPIGGMHKSGCKCSFCVKPVDWQKGSKNHMYGKPGAACGKYWINNHQIETYVEDKELNHWLSLGWIKGRIIRKKKTRSNSFTGKRWVYRDKIRRVILRSELVEYLTNGWCLGMWSIDKNEGA